MAALAAGVKEEQSLREAGFSDPEIETWKGQTAAELSDAGFSGREIGEYFGVQEPDMSKMEQYFTERIAKYREAKAAENAPKPSTPESGPKLEMPEPAPQAADSILEALEAGWDMSVTGLIGSGKPDMILPEHAPRAARIASQIGTLAGDMPAMIAGWMAGGSAGSAVPVVGTAVGAWAGSNALPTAIRETLMEHYEKGDIKDFGDFWDRSSAVFWKTLKAGAVGAAAGKAGQAVGNVFAPSLTRGVAVASSEIATMVTVGAALEGEVPKAQEFIDAAILIGGTHMAGGIASKIRRQYAKTGEKPHEVLQRAQTDPAFKEELVSKDPDLQNATPVKGPDELAEPSAVLGENVKVEAKVEPLPKLEEKPAKGVERSEHETAVLNRIAGSGKAKEPVSWDKAYTSFVDDLHPIKQLTEVLSEGKPLKVKDDPYSLARLSRGAYGKADQFVELSPFKFESLENTGTQPLKKIVEPFKNDLDGFRSFAVASRTLELAARGIETGVDVEAAKAVVKAGKGKYSEGFKELVKYQNDTLAYLKDSGILKPEAFEAMKEANQSYVPFFRLMGEDSVAKGAGKGLAVKNPVKNIKGSERQIIDPIESIVKNTYLYVTLAERNRVMVKMAELANKSELGSEYMELVPGKSKKVEVKQEEVAKFLEEHGMDAELAEAFDIFRPASKILGPDEVVVYRKGKREVYSVTPELAKAVKALDRESMGVFMKILSTPAKLLRGGAVLSPDFMVRNLVRDQLSATILSKHKYIPVADALVGLREIFNKSEVYQSWLKSGGANSAMVAIDRAYIQQNIFKLSNETGLMSMARNVVKSPIEMLRVTSELIENSTRLGEFKKAVKGKKDADSIFKAGMSSREVTLDFARIGASTRAMNMITAFWNAHVQGLDRTARAFQENPQGMLTKTMAAVTLPSVLLWMANKDDPRYQELPRWQKDLFWIVMTDDTIYRIPKPFELGLIFGSLPERVLESFYQDNPKAFKDFSDSLMQAFTPSYMPTFAVPVIEHFANKSTFTGNRVIPANLEGLLPEYQFTEYTSETAKAIGKLIGAMPGQKENRFGSPAVIDNYIRAWTGNLGQYVLKIADDGLRAAGVAEPKVKPLSTLADIPVIKAFVVRYPSATAQSIQDFYDRHESNKKVIDTIRHLAKKGDIESARKEMFLDANRDNLVKLDGIRSALTTQNKVIQFIHQNPEMTPEDKRQQIDTIYNGMIELTRGANKMLEQMDKNLKEIQ